jgi:glycosyltransferase involved in cell wall biosynthesis
VVSNHTGERQAFLGTHDGILCFGGEDWWYHNRAHFDFQIMQCLARKVPVLLINSVGFRVPRLKDGLQSLRRIISKLRSATQPVSRSSAGFFVASPLSLPVWQRPVLARINVACLGIQVRKAKRLVGLEHPLVWVACPPAFEIVKRIAGDAFLVYQRTDKYEEYCEQTREYIASAHRWLSQRADLIVYASTALYEEERHANPHCVLVGHGVELERFDPARALEAGVPDDLTHIKRPIVGFFGEVSDDKVDMRCVAAIARALPEVSFVFVGRYLADPTAVRGISNIHFLGMKPYEEVARYGIQFDVAIMPWKRSPFVYYCNPVKLKEYLALGLPVVSSDFPEALLYQDAIFVAHNNEEFVRGIREALAGRAAGTRESRCARAKGETWEQVATRIAGEIRALAGVQHNDLMLQREAPALQVNRELAP